MINANSPEFMIGRKIGHAVMTYVGVRLIIKGTKMIIKHGGALLLSSSPVPVPMP